MESVLVIGKSGSGKTFLANRMAAGSGKDVYKVADRGDGSKKFKSVGWDGLEKLRDCCVVFDDLISCSKTQFSSLQNVLNYKGNHHGVSPAIVCCHSIYKNNVYSLLHYVSHVYFTLSKCNEKSVTGVLDFFKFSPEERASASADFKGTRDRYGYFLVDVEAHTFARHRLGSGAIPASPAVGMEDYRDAARRFLKELGNDRAFVLFEMILLKLPLSCLSPRDLSVTLKLKSSDAARQLSLIDYLHALLVPDRPSQDMLILHRFVEKYVTCMPKCFVVNKALK
jgi:hypothetical protein